MTAPAVWIVRGGRANELAARFKNAGHVAIGWRVGDVSRVRTRDELRKMLEAASREEPSSTSVGQLFRFAKEIRPGDYVLTPQTSTGDIHVARCIGPYCYDPCAFSGDYPHLRPIHYLKAVPRASFPANSRGVLASLLTVFRADVLLPYLEKLLGT